MSQWPWVCYYLACEQGGIGGREELSPLPPFLPQPHPWESLLACYLQNCICSYLHHCHGFNQSLCHLWPFLLFCVTVSRAYCLWEFYPNSTSSSCGRDHENDPTSRRSTDQRLKSTLFCFAGAWKPCGDTLSVLTLTISMCGRVLRIWLSRPS